MKKLSGTKLVVICLSAFMLQACCGSDSSTSKEPNKCTATAKAPYSKKYTNADFYTDGKFNEAVAFEAFKDLFEYYDVPFTPLMAEDMWVTDFGMGDFEHAGMGGIFWVNDSIHNYFAHEIYLLPLQMIPEHAHVPTTFPAKFETWMVRNGLCYNFSEIGEATPNPPALPESQKGTIRSKNFTVQHVGEVLHLKKSESFHFLFAGPEGAIVSEWASYHDGKGLRFTNPKASM